MMCDKNSTISESGEDEEALGPQLGSLPLEPASVMQRFVNDVERMRIAARTKTYHGMDNKISGEEMLEQINENKDIVRPKKVDVAPRTKRLMRLKERSRTETLFGQPGLPIPSTKLSQVYKRHLCTRPVGNEDFGTEADEDCGSQAQA